MLTYITLKRDRRKFLALTGLTLKEFTALLPTFAEVYRHRYAGRKNLAGRKRKRAIGGGRHGQLATMAQKLLFVLVYQKTYPLQVVQGELFGMSQSGANRWLHCLLPLLQEALRVIGVAPERDGRQFAQAERQHREPPEYIIDGTERRRVRPKKPEKQALHYSGKKKAHTDKNIVIANAQTNRVGYLSPTHLGKTHDKKIAEGENITYPRQAALGKDTGFQGYEPRGVRTYQPKKSRVDTNSRPETSGITARYPVSESALSMRSRVSNARVV
jgi:Helix-turn-helix of DDE superfamily endonuclease/DDE superfamily endonuclease